MKFFKLIILSLTFLFCSTSYAQQTIVIRGKVLDSQTKSPVSGASVVELDKENRTVRGTTTNINGEYALGLQSNENKLSVSIIGYQTVTEAIQKRTKIDVFLVSRNNQLTEVAVTGTRAKAVNNGSGLNIKEKDVTTAFSRIEAKELEEMAANSIDQALQGRLSGVDIGTTSGDPGAGMSIRIRGTASLSGSSNPLIVLNGMPYETEIPEDFNFGTSDEQGYAQLLNISPADILDITVLKDAASTAIWGARAANGVLVINTKRGEVGKPVVGYTFRGTLQKQPAPVPMLNGDQYSTFISEAVINRFPGLPLNLQLYPEFQYDPNNPYYYYNYSNNTDWISEITRLGTSHDHNVSVSGGGEKATYYTSVGYVNNKGTTIGTDLQRINSTLNLDYNVSSRLRFRTDISYTYVNNNQNFTNTIRSVAYNKMPNMAVYEYDEYGHQTPLYLSPASTIQGFTSISGEKISGTYNPVAMANQGIYLQTGNRITPRFNLNFRAIPDLLTTTFDVQFDINNGKYHSFLPQIATGRPQTETIVNRAMDRELDQFEVSTKFNLIYTPKIGEHHDLQGIFSFQTTDRSDEQTLTLNSNTASAWFQDPSLPSRTTESGLKSEFKPSRARSIGTLLQGQYKYFDKYILNVGVRMDGNSRFGPNNRFGYFPSVSGRWRVSDENFMEGLKDLVEDFSIRGSYGKSGKVVGPSFYGQYSPQSWNYLDLSGTYPSQIEMSDLRWETVVGKNLGFNLWFLNRTLRIDAEIYTNTTHDMFYKDLIIPSYTGFDKLSMNAGVMSNSGWEISLTTIPYKKGNWNIEFNLNFARNQNKIVEISEFYPNVNNVDITKNGNYRTYLLEGNPFGSFYGYKYKGVYKDENATIAVDKSGNQIADPNGNPVYMRYNYPLVDYIFQPGDAIYEDVNKDGTIDYRDIVYLGNGIPKVSGGFGPKIIFKKRFTFQAFFNYRLGYSIVNENKMLSSNMYGYNNQSTAILKRWRNDGDETDMPRALYNAGYNWLGSDRYVEDASFVRLRSVTLRYNLSANELKRMSLKNASIYVTGENLYTWTKYTGQDPDVSIMGSADPFKYPVDRSMTPPVKQFTLGFVVGF